MPDAGVNTEGIDHSPEKNKGRLGRIIGEFKNWLSGKNPDIKI